MKRRTLIALSLLAWVAVAGAATAGELDGRSFAVSMADPGGESQPDTLIFADGTFDAVECRQYGFGAVAYSAEKTADGWTFTAKATSEEEGVAHWKGSVSGDSISGTMEWVKPGQDTIVYEFSGKLES